MAINDRITKQIPVAVPSENPADWILSRTNREAWVDPDVPGYVYFLDSEGRISPAKELLNVRKNTPEFSENLHYYTPNINTLNLYGKNSLFFWTKDKNTGETLMYPIDSDLDFITQHRNEFLDSYYNNSSNSDIQNRLRERLKLSDDETITPKLIKDRLIQMELERRVAESPETPLSEIKLNLLDDPDLYDWLNIQYDEIMSGIDKTKAIYNDELNRIKEHYADKSEGYSNHNSSLFLDDIRQHIGVLLYDLDRPEWLQEYLSSSPEKAKAFAEDVRKAEDYILNWNFDNLYYDELTPEMQYIYRLKKAIALKRLFSRIDPETGESSYIRRTADFFNSKNPNKRVVSWDAYNLINNSDIEFSNVENDIQANYENTVRNKDSIIRNQMMQNAVNNFEKNLSFAPWTTFKIANPVSGMAIDMGAGVLGGLGESIYRTVNPETDENGKEVDRPFGYYFKQGAGLPFRILNSDLSGWNHLSSAYYTPTKFDNSVNYLVNVGSFMRPHLTAGLYGAAMLIPAVFEGFDLLGEAAEGAGHTAIDIFADDWNKKQYKENWSNGVEGAETIGFPLWMGWSHYKANKNKLGGKLVKKCN